LQQPIAVGDRVLDRYRAVDVIASGGHSVVYRGEDERLSRPVCIKVFSKLTGTPGVWRTSYEHFVQEAFALSRLSHPNTLRIYDFGHLPEAPGPDGEESGVPLQISEFLNGGTLGNLVRDRGPQPAAEVVRVIAMMCDALAEAHAAGIVHRDLKPQNILFTTVGAARLPKLADFGIAKWFEGTAATRCAGDTQVVAGRPLVMYSPSWAAPEQLIGDPVGPTADIYSLAVVAVYMATGKAIFASEDIETGYRRRQAIDGVLASLLGATDLPPATIALLKQACNFDPDARPQHVDQLATALRDSYDLSVPTRTSVASMSSRPIASSIVADGSLEDEPLTTPKYRSGPLPTAAGSGALVAALPLPPGPDSSPRREPPKRAESPRLASVVPELPTKIDATASGRPIRRLPVGEGTTSVGDRVVRFVPVQSAADVLVLAGVARLRLTLLPGLHGRPVLHIKALNCFVARSGGRPSSAVQIDGDGGFDLINPRSQPLGGGRVSFGSPAAGHTLFRIGAETVAVGLEECPDAILIDYGAGAECHFVYARPARDPGRGRWRKPTGPSARSHE
jgi:serine/threonine-protein kinase